ncbi:MAG: insulinase family protein [Cyanobacteria bacterium M_surface_7_m2_040]|nr:insulinase family protein [Cyanobacteria bacterium M_surface_7_m2_040]
MGLALPTAAPADLLGGLDTARTWTLASGSRVVTLPLRDAPLVCLDLWCRAGSAFETPAESGLAHFLEHMVFKGSDRQAAGAFDLNIEALGGSSNAATGFDDVHYHVLVPPEAAAEACELLLDLVLQPRLDRHDFDLERQVVLEELAQSQDQPDEMALQTLLELGCSPHPYGRAILGEQALLDAHTPAAMRNFQQRRYRSEHCVLALSGALPQEQLDTLLEQLQRSPLNQLLPAAMETSPALLQLQPGLHRRSFARLEAARLLMAWALPPAADRPAVAALDLATSLLAEGRRSRLVERLREQLRLVESIDLDLQVLEFGSLALLEAVCDPADIGAVRQEVNAVLAGSLSNPPDDQELARGLRLVGNGYRFGLESPAGVAGVIGNSALWQRPLDLHEPLTTLMALDNTALQAAFRLLDPDQACILEAMPA